MFFEFSDPRFDDLEVIFNSPKKIECLEEQRPGFLGDIFDYTEIGATVEEFDAKIYINDLWKVIDDKTELNLQKKITTDIVRNSVFLNGQRTMSSVELQQFLNNYGYMNAKWWLLAHGGGFALPFESLAKRFPKHPIRFDAEKDTCWVKFDPLSDTKLQYTNCSTFFVGEKTFTVVLKLVMGDAVGQILIFPM